MGSRRYKNQRGFDEGRNVRTVSAGDGAALAGLLLGPTTLPGQVPLSRGITTGRGHNSLLKQIITIHSQGRRDPKVALDPALLRHINLTRGKGGNFGLLKNGGQLNWPPLFAGESFRGDRASTEELIGKALRQLRTDPTKQLGSEIVQPLEATVKRLIESVLKKVADLSPSEYITATWDSLIYPLVRRFQEIVWATFLAVSFGVRCSAPLSFFCFPAAQAKEKEETSKESGAEHRTPKDAATLAQRFP